MRRIHVGEVEATVQAVAGDALPPATVRQLAMALAMVLAEQHEAERRSRRDTRITGGVAAEMEQEDRA